MDALRRSTLELWQYFEKLSFNTMLYRGPAITHPSVGFYLSLNIQFVVGDLSISGTTPLTIFWARTPGLWQTTELAKHQHISHLYGQVPQVLVIAQLTLSPPAYYLYRRLDAAVFFSQHFRWKFLLAWCRYVAACFYDFHVYRRLGAALVQVRRFFFLYLTIFPCSASPGCPFASSPSRSHEVCHLANRLFFPSSHFLCGSRCSDLLLARFALHILGKKKGLGSPPVPHVSLPFSRGSNSTYLFPCLKCFFKSDEAQSSRFQRLHFPWGHSYKYTACIFTSTCFKIPG